MSQVIMVNFFAALLLTMGAALGQGPSAGTAAPISDAVNAAIQGHSIQCRVMLEDEHLLQVAETLAFQILKAHRKLLTHSEDRLLVELAATPRDTLLSQLSPDGQQEVASLLRRRLTAVRIAGALTGTTAISERQAAEIIVGRSHEGLRRIVYARNHGRWDDVIRIFESLSADARGSEFALQQLAFALNRRGAAGDVARAEAILRRLMAEGSENGETFGLLARIYKDRYYAALEDEAPATESKALLDEAIQLYRQGFSADTNNYYPAIALMHLLVEQGTTAALQEANDLSGFIAFSLAHVISTGRDDVWVYASAITVSALGGQWDKAEAHLNSMLSHLEVPWMATTTRRDLERLRRNLGRMNAPSLENGGDARLAAIIARLRQRESSHALALATSPSPAGRVTGEGIIRTGPVDVAAEAAATGFGLQLEKFQRYGRAVMDPQDFLRQYEQNLGGALLGMTKDHHRPLYQGYANATGLEPWWEGYRRLGIDAANDSQHTAHYMERITATGEPVVFLVPRGLYHSTTALSFTATEMEWILAEPETRARNVVFVFGAYEMIPEQFVTEIFARRGATNATNLMSTIIRGYQRFLIPRTELSGN